MRTARATVRLLIGVRLRDHPITIERHLDRLPSIARAGEAWAERPA